MVWKRDGQFKHFCELGDTRKCMADRGAVGVHRRALRHLQRAAAVPGKPGQQRIASAPHNGGQVAVTEIDRHVVRHLVDVVDDLHRAAHRESAGADLAA